MMKSNSDQSNSLFIKNQKKKTEEEMIDLHLCIKKISKGEILDEYEVKFICEKVTELFAAEANIQELSSPITIVGDIHG